MFVIAKTDSRFLDIGKNMKDAGGREKLFYEHQLRNCECELSEEIDTDHELDFESVREAESVATEENKDEE